MKVWGEPSFRDTLCDLISHTVTQASVVEDDALSLEFDNGSVWTASLRDEDQRGPEALMFQDEQRSVWFVL